MGFAAISNKMVENPDRFGKGIESEEFENKCQECGRRFTSPYLLQEHRKYICIQQETDEENEEETNEIDKRENQKGENKHEPMNQDTRNTTNMPICNITIMNKDDEQKTDAGKAVDREGKKGQEGNSTQGNNVYEEGNNEDNKDKKTHKKGYMAAKGKPRQPRKTQDNKMKTLRYEQETETWHCTKCPKKYSKRNAVSTKSHASAHTKEEKKTEQLAMKKHEEKKQTRTKMNSGYGHCKNMDRNLGENTTKTTNGTGES